MNYTDERKVLIDDLANISNSIEKKKDTISKLAKNIENSLDKPDIINMAKVIGIDKPEKKHVTQIIMRLKEKHFPNISKAWIYANIGQEYKEQRTEELDESPVVRLTPNYVKDHEKEIRDMLRRIAPRHEEIIHHEKVEEMEKYDWKCFYAQEIAKVAIKMEHEHDEEHDHELCKEYAERAKTTRDSRFATDMNSYEAIILAINQSKSLANAISGEWEFFTRWQVEENEDKCTKCITGKLQCKHEKCKCVCHRVVKPMTTKGLKYAIKTNEKLKEWDDHIKRLTTLDNDICKIGKVILDNPKSVKYLAPSDRKKLIYSHIEKDECLQCDLFLEKHPKFFEFK